MFCETRDLFQIVNAFFLSYGYYYCYYFSRSEFQYTHSCCITPFLLFLIYRNEIDFNITKHL